MIFHDDTIAAVSTPPGKGGIAVIRISGKDSQKIAERVFCPHMKKISDYPYRHAVYGKILLGGKPIDTGLLTLFRAPFSFTGEDMAEISCHGGILVTSMVLRSVLSEGARQAQAGEFTRRSFINGRLTLAEAESIGGLLEAKSELGVMCSGARSADKLIGRLSEISDRIVRLVASLYAYIDYPDEDLQDMTDAELGREIDEIISLCRNLEKTYAFGSAVTYGVETVIAGKPNVGKSSLFNLLAGQRKAIVTEIPGTTRDVLETAVNINGIPLLLSDTAGLRRSTDDRIEKIGVELAWEKLKGDSCSLILAVFDCSRPLDAEDRELIDALKTTNKQFIPIFNKCDKINPQTLEELSRQFAEHAEISAVSNNGIDELKEKIKSLYMSEEISVSDDAVISNSRHYACLSKALEKLSEAKKSLEDGFKEVVGLILEEALGELYQIDGRGVSERVVNEIFSNFCVGK